MCSMATFQRKQKSISKLSRPGSNLHVVNAIVVAAKVRQELSSALKFIVLQENTAVYHVGAGALPRRFVVDVLRGVGLPMGHAGEVPSSVALGYVVRKRSLRILLDEVDLPSATLDRRSSHATSCHSYEENTDIGTDRYANVGLERQHAYIWMVLQDLQRGLV